MNKSKNLREINNILKGMLGNKMTKEQLLFQEILREKVKNKEITIENAHKIWREKYEQE